MAGTSNPGTVDYQTRVGQKKIAGLGIKNEPFWRLTALWALSEAGLGGVLHGLHVPLTGLFVGGAAIILLTLLADYSRRPFQQLLKATLIVVVIKALVSPHTPLNAYGAVMLQGALAAVLFAMFKTPRAAYALGLLSMLIFSLQKFALLTVVFGFSIWHSLDLLLSYAVQQMGLADLNAPLSITYWVLGVYIFLHLSAGVLSAFLALRWRIRLREVNNENSLWLLLPCEDYPALLTLPRARKKNFFSRYSNYFLLLAALLMTVVSLQPWAAKMSAREQGIKIILRSLTVFLLWYGLAAPRVMRWFKRFVRRKKTAYASEISTILRLLPQVKQWAAQSWHLSKGDTPIKRLFRFVRLTLLMVLFSPYE